MDEARLPIIKEWTLETLYVHFLTLINEKEKTINLLVAEKDKQLATQFSEREKYFVALVTDKERALKERFEYQDKRYSEVTTSAAEAVKTAFASSEKAIAKQEAAQADYNIRSNEFRGQLADQAKTLMPRNETAGLFAAVSEKIDTNVKTFDQRMESFTKTRDDKVGDLLQRIEAINSRLTTIESRGAGGAALWGYIVGAVGLICVVVSAVVLLIRHA